MQTSGKGGKKGRSGGDMPMTGNLVKGESCSAGVTKASHRVVSSFPVGFSHSRTSVKGKK